MIGALARPHESTHPRWQLWPAFTLLLIEVIAFGYALTHHPSPQLPITRFSIAVAAISLLVTWGSAWMRPSRASALALCFNVLLSSALLVVIPPRNTPIADGRWALIEQIPPMGLLWLSNVILNVPFGLHFVCRHPRVNHVPTWALATIYGITVIGVGIAIFVPLGDLMRPFFRWLLVWDGALIAASFAIIVGNARAHSGLFPRIAQQARTQLIATLISQIPLIVYVPVTIKTGNTDFYPWVLLAQLALPLGNAYSMLRHDLFGIDTALRRATAYAAASAIFLSLYLGFTAVLTQLLAQFFPNLMIAPILAVVLAALAFQPVRLRVQQWIDCTFYPQRMARQHALTVARMRLSRVMARHEITTLLRQLEHEQGNINEAIPAYDGQERAQLQATIEHARLMLAYADTISELNTLNANLESEVAMRTAQVLDQQRNLAVLDERQRLARELHDSVTQQIFSISLGARALRKQIGKLGADATLTDELAAQERTAQQALSEMRSLLAQLRGAATTPAPVSLAQSLREMANEFATSFAIAFDLTECEMNTAKHSYELSQVAREALRNAQKHSGATQVQIQVEPSAQNLCLHIRDNGCGFDANAPTGPLSFGLRGMAERLALLGGTLHVTSSKGQGTTITACLPITI